MRLLFLLGATLFLLFPASKTLAQHYYYIPNTTSLPAVGQRHDSGMSVGWNRTSAAKAIEIQGYYSPINNVVVLANYMNSGEKEVLNNTKEGLKFRFYEIGAGLYEKLPKGTASVLVGFAHGNMYNYFLGEEYADMDLQRIFIQPGILYHDDFFQGGISLRLSRIAYTKARVGIAIPENHLLAIRNIEEKSPFLLPEIGVSGGIRFSPFVFGVNFTGIFPRTDNLNFVRVNSSVFVCMEFGKIIRKVSK